MRSVDRPFLITGGAGFVGCNLASRLLRSQKSVLLLDNLSRPGVAGNLNYLQTEFGEKLRFVFGDIRDRDLMRELVRESDAVVHLAAQTAVTTSLVDPIVDSEINLGGTLSVLEALRRTPRRIPLLFTSTNKVYGNLEGLQLSCENGRYCPEDAVIAENGISEEFSLNFQSPYGCSKGAADQYVLDYARSYKLPAMVFRMSCIYGPHQCGTEDQGWVAHFASQVMQGKPIRLFGDGMQVRDVLYVEDLTAAIVLAVSEAHALSGQAFNIGGGVRNTITLLELIDRLHELIGTRPETEFYDWRVGDQRYYVSDITHFHRSTGWRPLTSMCSGLQAMTEWMGANVNAGELALPSGVR